MFYRNRSTRALTSPIHPCTLVRCSPSGVWCGDGACVSEFPLTVSSAHMYFMCQPILGNLYNISVLCIFTVVQHFFRSPDYWDFFFIRSFCAIHHFLRITNAYTNAGIADTHTLTPFFFSVSIRLDPFGLIRYWSSSHFGEILVCYAFPLVSRFSCHRRSNTSLVSISKSEMAKHFCFMVARSTCFLLDSANIRSAMVFWVAWKSGTSTSSKSRSSSSSNKRPANDAQIQWNFSAAMAVSTFTQIHWHTHTRTTRRRFQIIIINEIFRRRFVRTNALLYDSATTTLLFLDRDFFCCCCCCTAAVCQPLENTLENWTEAIFFSLLYISIT